MNLDQRFSLWPVKYHVLSKLEQCPVLIEILLNGRAAWKIKKGQIKNEIKLKKKKKSLNISSFLALFLTFNQRIEQCFFQHFLSQDLILYFHDS